MGRISANPYIPDTKARITLLTPLLDPKNPMYICPQANIKAANGFYDDGIATIYPVDGRRVNSLSEALLGYSTRSNVVSKF